LTTDRFASGVLALFALLVIWESRVLPLGTFRQPGPAYIPILLASLLLIFAIFLAAAAGRAPSFSSIHWTEWRHALAILASCVFTVAAMERLGYRLTLLLVLGFLLKIVEKRGWRVTIAFALSLAFGSFYLFYTLLRVPLPQGSLGF
jgi:hypothetical protein